MSRSTVRQELFINDGTGIKKPISTGIFATNSVNIDEHRRLSLTIGVTSATGAIGDIGGFTGTLVVQGTNELAECYGATGTPDAGGGSKPGKNGFTGALYWNTIGTTNINSSTSSVQLDYTDVGVAFVRIVFNQGILNPVGSGTMKIFLTAKNT